MDTAKKSELEAFIKDAIQGDLAELCIKLEQGQRSDSARVKFRDKLASVIVEAIDRATS